MSCSCGTSSKVKTRCNPHPVEIALLSDDEDTVVIDSEEKALITGITKTGTGTEFEFNRQETQP